jgi:hypothetical protein
LGRVADCGRDELDLRLVKVHFGNWDEKYRLGRFVRLSKEDEYLFIRAVNRFSEEYKKRLRKRLWPLRYVKWDLKLELTLDPCKFMRLVDEFAFIDKAWAKARSWLYKRYGHFEFLKVLEVQKKGRPHLHILISGISYIPHGDLYEIWQKYGGGFVWIRPIEKSIDAVSYVLKYVNKTILSEDKIYAALLFASNKRMFSMSHGLRDMLVAEHKFGKQGYTFRGTIEESEVKVFCVEENMVYDDFVKAKLSTEILYRYPQLFDVFDTG